MLKANLGTVEIKGNYVLLMAELTTLIKGLAENMDKEDIMRAVNDGLKTEEENTDDKEEFFQNLEELITDLKKHLML